ncbi:TetR/AcrR family transcriptional regulator [Paenibacillus psychroresistens]|uniref:TetR/AcrR family transcriptional regulator n=1 Tax=Paenibacillus psychroresistens TaxID=1778678 RepID=A0A6B8RPZ5_9BACL|nr:TetR/AcrR family transcriptional regulator [Paenibacillus psychroresistens]QGQ97605.1 TetR/AcrR family transcriptional regulator [Paenibacillus psychroresistens]
MSPRKAVDHELSRERILEVARAQFVQHGYRDVSMRGIAKELGYSPGSLYYHFREKADLFSAMTTADFHELDGLLKVAISTSPNPGRDRLGLIFLYFIRFGLENKRSFELMFLIQEPGLDCYTTQAKADSYEKFFSAVRESLQVINVDRAEDIELIWVLFLSLHGFVSFYIHSNQSFDDIAKLADVHTQLLLRGLA